jgi:hypothetical protein
MASAFAQVNKPHSHDDIGDDDVTYADVHRQVMLIFNFLVSILGVAATVWIAARWWSTPARLALSMTAAIVVAIAEVAVYSGFIWRLGQAKGKQGKVKEVKAVVNTWVVGGHDQGSPVPDRTTPLTWSKDSPRDSHIRHRHRGRIIT